MNAPPSDPSVQLRGAQVVHAALVLSVVGFAGIAALLGPVGTPLAPIAGGLDAVALAAAALTLVGASSSFLLPARAFPSDPSDPEVQRLAAFRAQKLMAAALCEGPAMLWCVALLLGGNDWYLLAIGALVALMAFHFPTRDAVQDATGVRVRGG